MHATIILEPLDVLQLQNKINTYFWELGTYDKDITYAEVLQQLHITHEQCTFALSSTVKKSKLFLDRNVKDICINAYMKEPGMMWQVKDDIQYVLDT